MKKTASNMTIWFCQFRLDYFFKIGEMAERRQQLNRSL